jgi:hypothetical protein
MSQSNILFFSQNCQYSKKLISKIINTPLYNSLQKVCIDDPQTRSRLPKWVTCVPMIYLTQPPPGLQNPLKDQDLWMWLEQQLSQFQQQNQPPQPIQFQNQRQQPPQQPQFQQQQPQFQQHPQQQQQPPQQQQQQTPQPGGNSGFDGFEPYNFSEMKGGIASDNYSLFFKDDNASQMNANLFPHTYETVNGMGGNQQNNQNNQNQQMQGPGQGQQQNNTNSRTSQKQERFDQEFAMKKAMRDQDVGLAPQARKQEGIPDNFNQMFEANTRR